MVVICECGNECEKVAEDAWLCGSCGAMHASFDDEPDCEYDDEDGDDE